MHSITPEFVFMVLFVSALIPAVGEDFRPNLGPELSSITVTCDDVTVLLRRKSQWTPGRIDFRGVPMTTESSAYGTVFRFPEVGFIGTAHLENEAEDLTSLAFFLDGESLDSPSAEVKGQTFRFERESKVRTLRLRNVVELKNNRLFEMSSVSAVEDTPLDLVYHFMHAWVPTTSAMLAGSDASPNELIQQPLLDGDRADQQFYINRPVDWVAVYEPRSQQFAVSRLLETPPNTQNPSKLWNCRGIYRKYYLTSFQNKTVPKGFTGTWRMVTAFGKGAAETWRSSALNLAKEISR